MVKNFDLTRAGHNGSKISIGEANQLGLLVVLGPGIVNNLSYLNYMFVSLV